MLARKKFKKLLTGTLGKKNFGYCPICKSSTIYIEFDTWLRDHYQCVKCKSIPRQRSLVNALNLFYPDWPNLVVHESSPSFRMFTFFKKECKSYTASQFFEDITIGEYKGEFICEDLTNLTFENDSIDIIITQDVFEHVLFPFKAFREIARVLKPGGVHIFTMPWYGNLIKSKARVKQVNNEMIYLEPPVYHGNPVDKKGSLVTYDWGLDFTDLIFEQSKLFTTIYLEKNRKFGLDAKFLEVFISRKLKV